MFAIRIQKSVPPKDALVVLVFESMKRPKIGPQHRIQIKEVLDNYAEKLEKIFCDYDEYGPSYAAANGDY